MYYSKNTYSMYYEKHGNGNKNIIILSKNLDSVLLKKYNNQYSNISFIT